MSVIADLVRAGVDPDLIEKVHAEILAASKATDEQAERRRAADRERKRQKRLRNSAESADNADAASPLLSSPTPPTNNPLPQSSLRSVSVQAREVFASFWTVYPKRTNRKAAFAKLETALKAGVDPEKIIGAAQRYSDYVRFTEPQFIKAPDAWLNAGKYDDELPDEPPHARARAGPRPTSAVVEMLNELNGTGNGTEPQHPIRDITPTGAPEPRGRDLDSDLFEPGGKSPRGQVLDFGSPSPDLHRSAAAYGKAWGAG